MRFSLARYNWRSLRYSPGVHIAIGVVVACIATVLTGALLIGDSMRQSLRELTFKQLGPIDSIIRRDDFFTPTQALSALESTGLWSSAVAGIVLDGSLTIDEKSVTPVACGTTVVGIDDRFWNAWFGQDRPLADRVRPTDPGSLEKQPGPGNVDSSLGPPSTWKENEIVVNRQLARSLMIGSAATTLAACPADLNFLEYSPIPSENTFGKKDDVHARHRFQIRGVIENDIGPGSFSLALDQTSPRLVFVPLHQLQEILDLAGQVNTIFLLGDPDRAPVSADMIARGVANKLVFPLEELGVELSQKTFSDVIASDSKRKTFNDLTCVYISASRFFFSSLLRARIDEVLSSLPLGKRKVSPVCVYLANSIERLETKKNGTDSNELAAPKSTGSTRPVRSSVPYSLIAGIEPELIARFIPTGQNTQPADAIWINQFLANELGLVPGNRIRLIFFRPDDPSGLHRETEEAFIVAGIIPDDSPLDAHLVPAVHGLTDASSLADWNPTFPFDGRRIAKQDEDFWQRHHTAPKAFLPLDRAEQLFGSRFGSISSFCVLLSQSDQPIVSDTIRQNLESQLTAADAGLPIIPIGMQAATSSGGTTPFDVLFLCFSFFLIASVLIMLMVLVKLALDLKKRELGILMTLGFSSARIGRTVLGELLVPLFFGSLVGTVLGGLYTRVMVYGLCHWWIGAIGTPFVRWHGHPSSFLTGMSITFVSAVLTAMLVLRRIKKMQPIEAIDRAVSVSLSGLPKTKRFPKTTLGVIFLAVALVSVWLGSNASNMAPDMKAGLFFASASIVLTAAILLFDSRLTRAKRSNKVFHRDKEIMPPVRMNLFQLVVCNLSRHEWRTMLTITLLASSLFIVGSTGVFRLDTPETEPGKTPPLCVETRLPIFDNLLTDQGREALLTNPDNARLLQNTRFIPFRVRNGQRTGCSNLFRAGDNLRLLGVPHAFVKFLDASLQEKYKLLDSTIPDFTEGSTRVPVVPILLDRNTAMYALKLYSVGAKLRLQNDEGQLVFGQVVGFLDQSVFQSEVLMSESNLCRFFPEVNGWQFFYVEQTYPTGQLLAKQTDCPTVQQLAGAVAQALGDYGPSIETVPDRLARYFRVQNGYITIFQTLGALGVLLGTFGLTGLQAQDLYARRRELALLQTIGFSRKRIFTILFLENASMLALAVLMAWFATIVAVWPQLQDQLRAGTLSWTAMVPSTFFILPALGTLMVGLLSLVFVWRLQGLAELKGDSVLSV